VSIKAEFADKKDEMVSVRFVISDTGIGIEPTKQKTIFERFHQAQPETTRRYGGTGLGLSIVKQLVEIQNGTISVDSAPGEGSVFTVVLPYQISNEAETTGVRLSPVLVAGPVLNNIKILVAEDNLMNQKLLKHLLAQWQIDFDIVNNGAEAVKVLEQRPEDYALVLMDIQMPEMDGYAATERMRHDLDLRIPIIAMTAHALAGEKEKCLGAGMDDYISKPINEEELYKLINKYVQGNSPQDRSVIDLEYLKIISKGDEVFEKNMIRSFSIQMPEELNRLKSSILERDYEQIGSIAHNMKSTLAYMGLRQLTPLLQQIEQECKKQNGITRINDNFTLISATCKLAITEAKELIS
jgi:CheY-like chemotaxis protein